MVPSERSEACVWLVWGEKDVVFFFFENVSCAVNERKPRAMHRIGVHSYNILWWIPASRGKKHRELLVWSHREAQTESNDEEKTFTEPEDYELMSNNQRVNIHQRNIKPSKLNMCKWKSIIRVHVQVYVWMYMSDIFNIISEVTIVEQRKD